MQSTTPVSRAGVVSGAGEDAAGERVDHLGMDAAQEHKTGFGQSPVGHRDCELRNLRSGVPRFTAGGMP